MFTKTVTDRTIQEGHVYTGDDVSGQREETSMNKAIVVALILLTVCFLWSFQTISRVIRSKRGMASMLSKTALRPAC